MSARSSNLFLKDNSDWLGDLYMGCSSQWLTEINRYFIKRIMFYLNINCDIKDIRDYTLVDGKTEKLVSICEQFSADIYITRSAAQNYIDENLFADKEIEIQHANYADYKEYDEDYPPFEHGVSILDLILNKGKEFLSFLKNCQDK